jgi:hypothetical protein
MAVLKVETVDKKLFFKGGEKTIILSWVKESDY